MRLHCLQHVPFEGLGIIADWAAQREHSVFSTKFYRNNALPSLDTLDILVVMGGPMGVYSERDLPWLAAEKRFIEQAITRDKIVVGVCLGAQLIAEVLGGRVYRHTQPEIGWWPLQLTAAGKKHFLAQGTPETFTAFHWHRDTYDLPDRCINLTTTDACAQQMFIYGNKVLGLQFHAEVTHQAVRAMIEEDAAQWPQGSFVQLPKKILAEEQFFDLNRQLLFSWLDGLVAQPSDN